MRERRPNKINNLQRNAIRERRAKGEGLAEIAADYNVSTITIRHHTKDIKPKKARFLDVYADEILLLTGLGYSQSAIARKLKVHPSAINKLLSRMEWKAAA